MSTLLRKFNSPMETRRILVRWLHSDLIVPLLDNKLNITGLSHGHFVLLAGNFMKHSFTMLFSCLKILGIPSGTTIVAVSTNTGWIF